jgi:WD40 repeat protein
VIRRYLHLVLVVGLGLAILGLASWPAPADAPLRVQQANQQQTDDPPTKPCTDRFGDPLPRGARYRIGTVRLQHGDWIDATAAAPDGVHIASTGQDGTLSIWESATGRERLRYPKPDGGWLAFSPDSKRVAFNCDGELSLLDVESNKVIKKLGTTARAGHFAADGKSLTVVQEGRSSLTPVIRSWSLESGQPLKEWTYQEAPSAPGGVGIRVGPAAWFSADGAVLATTDTQQLQGQVKQILRLHDTITGKELRRWTTDQANITDVAFSPDGQVLACGCARGTIRIFDIVAGEKRSWQAEPLDRWTKSTYAVAFTPDGQSLVTDAEGGLTRWDWRTGKKLQVYSSAQGHASFCRQGKVLVAQRNGNWGGIVILDAETGKDLCPLPQPDGCVAVSADARLMVWAENGSIILADARSGLEMRCWAAEQGMTYALAFAPGGTVIASAGNERVCLWEVPTGRVLRSMWHKSVRRLVFSEDGRRLASTKWSVWPPSEVCVWEVATGKSLGRWEGNDLAVHDPTLSVVAVADSKLNALSLIEIKTGKMLQKLPGYQESVMYECTSADGKTSQQGTFLPQFSPDGQFLLAGGQTGSADGVVQIWDVATGNKQNASLDGRKFNLNMACSPDCQLIALMNSDRLMCLVSARTGEVIRKLGDGADAMDAEPAFTPDSRVVVTTVRGLVQFWEVATGGEIARRKAHRGSVSEMVAAGDCRSVVTVSWRDNTMLAWDLTRLVSDPPARALTKAELEAAWRDLADPDAVKGRRAIEALVAAPTQGSELLRLRLSPIAPVDEKLLAGWVEDLDTGNFNQREKATKELERLGEQAGPALKAAQRKGPSQEVQHRIEKLLQKLDSMDLPADSLRMVRAVTALELIGTSEARSVLEPLARGAAGARLTEEAKGSLQRLKKLAPAAVEKGQL